MVPSYRLKLQRALHHLSALSASAQGWAETQPVLVIGEAEIQTRKHRYCVRVLDQPADPSMPLLIGDSVHCMRQGLDHMAYALAGLVHNTDPPPNWETTQFPITSSITKFDGGLPSKIGRKKLMPPGLYDALEQLQPYHGGDCQLLATLHELDNLDKHRFVPVVAAVAHVPHINIQHLSGSSIQIPALGAIEDGKPIIEYIPAAGSQQDFNWVIEASIAFDKRSTVAPGMLVIPLLGSIRNFIVGRVLPVLDAYL